MILLFLAKITCLAQIYPLTTTDDVPSNAYIKDINNNLPAYAGTWKGSWNGKTFIINLKKIKYYNTLLEENSYYQDLLVGKFQVKDFESKILFDNMSISDNESKIKGGRMFPDGKYLLTYVDPDLCFKSGIISIEFTDSTKKMLNWKFDESENMIDTDCFYWGKPASERPEPLPEEIILTKQ